MRQYITLRAYTTDKTHKSSAFVSLTPDDEIVINSLDPKLPVEITLDGLGKENAIIFNTHYGYSLFNNLMRVYSFYDNVISNVTIHVKNGHTYHSAEDLSENYFGGIKVYNMYNPYYMERTMKRIQELLKDDKKLASILENISEEETMRALGYTKKETNNETNHNALC